MRLAFREGRAVLVVHIDFDRAALLALCLATCQSSDSRSTLAYSDCGIAGVALETPTLLLVVLEADVALEALNAEVDVGVLALVFQRDLCTYAVAIHIVSDVEHDGQNALHCSNREPEEVELVFENVQHVAHNFLEVSFASCNELAAFLDV